MVFSSSIVVAAILIGFCLDSLLSGLIGNETGEVILSKNYKKIIKKKYHKLVSDD